MEKPGPRCKRGKLNVYLRTAVQSGLWIRPVNTYSWTWLAAEIVRAAAEVATRRTHGPICARKAKEVSTSNHLALGPRHALFYSASQDTCRDQAE